MAYIKKTIGCISTCAWDNNVDDPQEICLNDICWHELKKEWGFITRHKREYFFESFNTLEPLTSFEGYIPNFKCTIKGLSVETDYGEIERFIRRIFTKSDLGNY